VFGLVNQIVKSGLLKEASIVVPHVGIEVMLEAMEVVYLEGVFYEP